MFSGLMLAPINLNNNLFFGYIKIHYIISDIMLSVYTIR